MVDYRQQIHWRGLVLGRPGPYQVTSVEGWEDLPGLDSGDVPRPARHGAWSGRPLAQARTITVEGRIRCGPDEVLSRVRDLRRACALPDDDTTHELVVDALGERLSAWGRVSQRIISHGRYTRLGHVPYTLQWQCPDPARYESDRVHLVVPRDGERTAPHHGDIPTRPEVTIYGETVDPVLRLTQPGRPDRVLGFGVTVAAGDALTIDTHAGTAALSDGTEALSSLTAGSVPVEHWTIPEGVPSVALESAGGDATGRAHLVYRHAHL